MDDFSGARFLFLAASGTVCLQSIRKRSCHKQILFNVYQLNKFRIKVMLCFSVILCKRQCFIMASVYTII
jgi:hypothetical protein